MKLKKNLFLILAFLYTVPIFAQSSYTLTGNVSDENGEPLIGAFVRVEDTTRGTVTDLNGDYQLEVSNGDVLLITSTGYESQSVTVSDQATLNFTLAEDYALLDDVVVVGYGTVKKSDVTGSVSTVTAEEVNAFPVLDVAQALQGRAAGVNVQSNNGGEPGAPIRIRVRGVTSISASSDPLIVVDGFVSGSLPQQSDIASIELLKDASATAIYGARATNGVLLITTKRGESGKPKVELFTSYATSDPRNRLDLLNANDFAAYQTAVRQNVALTNGNDPVPYTQGSENNDWQDQIYRNGTVQNHALSISGGTDVVKYYASGNYFDQEGIVINSGFERGTFLGNLEATPTDRLTLGLNLFTGIGTQDRVSSQSDGSVTVGNDDAIGLAFRFAPDLAIRDANGNFTTQTAVGDPLDNPFGVASARIDERDETEFRANLSVGYDILKNVNFKSTFGINSDTGTRGRFAPSTLLITDAGNGGVATLANSNRIQLLNENYLTFDTQVGDGDLTLLGGYSYQKTTTDSFSAAGTGFLSNAFSFNNLGSATGLLQPGSASNVVELRSYFGRANFDFDDRYLITATLRNDGATNFAENEKTEFFPSGAVAWRISNEPFWNENGSISNLKLRASYGVVGNPSIPTNGSLSRLDVVFASSVGQTVPAIVLDQPANPNLRIEKSYQTNIGVDLGLWNNRATITADYYNIDTRDIIQNDTGIPDYLGFASSNILTNVGEINNQGIEFAINTVNVDKSNFTWDTNFNISRNRNEVTSLINDADLFGNAAPSYFSVDRTWVLREGEAIGQFWGWDYAGVYQGGDFPEGTAALPGALAGDPLFRDLPDADGNVDGVINSADQTIIGDPNPDFTFGFNNNFTYGNFDLNVFFQGSQGNDIFNLTNVQLFNGDANTTQDYFENAWTSSNTNTDLPRVGNNSNREISSRFVEDGSYVRLKNLALGYTLPTTSFGNLGIQGIRLGASAQNLLTFTDYSGLDPEVNFFGATGNNDTGNNVARGHDFGNYPTTRTVTFSLNATF